MDRSFIIKLLVVVVALSFVARLFYLQLIDDHYKQAAETNVVQKIVDYPYRGLIYDRNDSLVVYNSPVFDLMVIPKEAVITDTLAFCELLEIEKEDLEERLMKARSYSTILASKLVEQVSDEVFARLQDQLVHYPGFYVLPRTIRSYTTSSLANVLGYIGEVNTSYLENDTSDYYRPGDFLGIGGIEKSYEAQLRGKRGATFKVVDVKGKIKDAYREGTYDTLPKPGANIKLTIDLDLQEYAEKLMEGKVGSLVAIEPKSGEILAFVSAPSYDPQLLSGKELSENFPELSQDPDKPLFNRPLQARYPPGSMFKTIQGVIALHEKVITPEEIVRTDGSNIGDLAPPGKYYLRKAIRFSSNNYFYLVMRRMVQAGEVESAFMDSRIGLEKWRQMIMQFGLGAQLGVDIPNEIGGNVPSVEFYDRVYGNSRWKYSNIGSLSIGQGELLVTPLQMANLGAILANRGFYITPHVAAEVDGIATTLQKKIVLPFDSSLFVPVIEGMEEVIRLGSGRRGYLEPLELVGKTSTVQNPHGEDHSGFMGFAPLDNPQISVAAYVENAGQGGRAAVSVASLVAEKYVLGEISRPWLEEYVLNEYYLTQNAPRPVIAEN